MNLFNRMSIALKLPLAFVACSQLALASLGVMTYSVMESSLRKAIESSLDEMRVEREYAVIAWFDQIKNVLRVEGRDKGVVEAIETFDAAYRSVGGDPTRHFHRLYIEDNPHPLGDKDALISVDAPSAYNEAHKHFHEHYRNVAGIYDFYDVFLFNAEGDLIYSVEKEIDFATNFVTGEWAGSGLGRAFQGAADINAGEVWFEDFAPYGP
ncbi:MAG: hypothetical protein AAFP78_12990, partial [Pseudomonadota bacterium]